MPKARNFDKYHLINAPDMPDTEIILIEDSEPGGPFGAKSIGEISTVPSVSGNCKRSEQSSGFIFNRPSAYTGKDSASGR